MMGLGGFLPAKIISPALKGLRTPIGSNSTVNHRHITVRRRAHATNLQRPAASITSGYGPITPKMVSPMLRINMVIRNDVMLVAGRYLLKFPE